MSEPGEQGLAERARAMDNDISGYHWCDGSAAHAHRHLLPTVMKLLEAEARARGEQRVFDLGCGNGSVAHQLATKGWEVAGVDPSQQGVAQARLNFPDLRVEVGSAYDDLRRYGQFPAVISLEVVEHVYDPRLYARTLFSLVQPGGVGIVSTPYHGYWKNLALALTGRMDAHFTALWDHGHIKFWSVATLSTLLTEAGFGELEFHRVGRLPPLAKAMVVRARRPNI